MPSAQEDADRENRIAMEIVVDAYNEDEVRMGWYYYLDDKLNCPFTARWISKGKKSSVGEDVEVIEMADEDECSRDMLSHIRYREGDDDVFSVPLIDLEPLDADQATREAIADWHYWVDRGYSF